MFADASESGGHTRRRCIRPVLLSRLLMGGLFAAGLAEGCRSRQPDSWHYILEVEKPFLMLDSGLLRLE